MIQQDLPSRYIDKQKLGHLWTTNADFRGRGCSIVNTTHEFITVEVPREMTPDEITSVYYDKSTLDKLAGDA
ncbi:hypothetical protein FVER14953_20025 [Fusarium verticillioides]|nr:hypothetical protein FVER14953_20025 [Fusarium verticillioides]